MRSIETSEPEAAGSLHLKAIWSLVWSDDLPSLTQAVDWLERSIESSPPDSGRLNDLSVALLLRADRASSAIDRLRAADAALRAIAANPGAREPRRNLDLALDQLGLSEGELRADRRERESWQALAERLKGAERSAVEQLPAVARSGFAQQLRELGEEELLGLWGLAELEGDATAARQLEWVISSLGEALAGAYGESVLRQEARALRESNAPARRERALAYADFATGLRAVRGFSYGAARAPLEKASRRLRALASPLANWADYYLGIVRYLASDLDGALEQFVQLAGGLRDGSGQKSLEARIAWSEAAVRDQMGDAVSAIRLLRAAGARFGEIGELENQAATRIFLFDILPDYGREEEAARELVAAQEAGGWITTPLRRHNIWLNWLELTDRLDLLHLRARVANQVELSAAEFQDPLARYQVLLERARSQTTDTGRRVALDLARASLLEIRDESVLQMAEGTLDLEAGRLLADGSPEAAERAATRAYLRYSSTGMLFACDALIARASARLRMGRFADAAADLELAFSELVAHRDRASDAGDRARFLERLDAALLAWTEAAWATSTDWQDFWRHLALRRRLWRLGEKGPGPESEAAFRASLLPDQAVLEFAVLRSRTLLFVFRRTGSRVVEIPVGQELLARSVDGLTRSLAGGQSDWRSRADDLFDLLLSEVAPDLDGAAQLAIVPDGPIFRLPFWALLASRDAKRWVGPVALEIALTSWNPDHRAEPRVPRVSRSALFIADPDASPELFPELPSLRGAADAARASSSLYEVAEVLEGPRASLEEIERLLAQFAPEIIELSSHTFPDPGGLDPRGIILAPSAQLKDGVLRASRLAELRLAGSPLVILAGCRTAESSARQGGTRSLGLGAAALEAGAGSVLSAHWDLDDTGAGAVLSALHGRLIEGIGPSKAVAMTVAAAWNSGSEIERETGVSLQLLVSTAFTDRGGAFEPPPMRR